MSTHSYSEDLAKTYSQFRNEYNNTDEKVFSVISEIGVGSKNVLDFGCGDGRYSYKFLDLGAESVTGIDSSLAMIELAKNNLRKDDVNPNFIVADGQDLPSKENSFDIVFSNFVLHYFTDALKPLKEIYRVLKPGGYFVATLDVYDIQKGWEHLENQEIFLKLGTVHPVSITNLIIPKETFKNYLKTAGFQIVQYESMDNSNAQIDPTYPHLERLKKSTMLVLCTKS